MSQIEVDVELLRALLDAALQTARSHRGKPRELYVLGQLEEKAKWYIDRKLKQIKNQ